MECVICKMGSTGAGTETVSLEKDGQLIVIRNVPGEVCENCGHFYVSADAALSVEAKVKKALEDGAELEVLQFA